MVSANCQLDSICNHQGDRPQATYVGIIVPIVIDLETPVLIVGQTIAWAANLGWHRREEVG